MELRSILLPVALVAVLVFTVPTASAAPELPDPTGDETQVGPCEARHGLIWPGRLVSVRCAVEDQEVIEAWLSAQSVGHCVGVELFGSALAEPCTTHTPA